MALIFALSFVGLFYVSLYSFILAVLVGFLSLVVYGKGRGIIAVVPVMLASALAYALTGYPEAVVFSAAFALPSLFHCIALKMKSTRIVTAGFGAFGYVIFFAMVFFYVVVGVSGGFGLDEIKETGDFAYKFVEEAVDKLLSNPDLPLAEDITKGEIMQAVSEWAKAMIYTTVGFVLSASFVLSYLQTALYRSYLKKRGLLEINFPDGFLPRPTMVSAVVFALTLIFQFVLAEMKGADVLYITLSNLLMIFEVIFAIYGFTVTLGFFRRRSILRTTLLSKIFIAAFFLYFLSYGITILYLVGVISVIRASFKRKEG